MSERPSRAYGEDEYSEGGDGMSERTRQNGLPRGVLKSTPADFLVDEIPAYEPCGDGPHLYVRFRKTNLTTEDAVRSIARSLGIDRREIGVAGLKDKVAVTTQWISLPTEGHGDVESRLGSMNIEGVEVL